MAKHYSYALAIFGLLNLFASTAKGQIDTVLLESVEVAAQSIRLDAPGVRTEIFKTEETLPAQSLHLGDLLASRSGAFIKSYGQGSSATTSIRGGSAGHTALIWNGIPLQNPMLGQLDFSLIPVQFIDEVSLESGGNSAGWGSGAIGGVINIQNSPKQIKGFSTSLRSELGSFGWQDHQAKIQYGKGRLKGSSRYFRQEATNDFTYTVGSNEKTQSHAAFNQQGAFQELYYQLGSKQQLGLQAWWQQNNREIPALTTQRRSEAKQSDEFLRTALQWKYFGQQFFTQVRLGFFDDHQNYNDPLSNIDATNQFNTYTLEGEAQWQINATTTFEFGVLHIQTKAKASNYPRPIKSKQYALFGAVRKKWKSLLAQISLRQEWLDNQQAPIVPSIGLNYDFTKWLQFSGRMSKNYRLPTLNDRFWTPGGQANLKAENGWSEEIGIRTAWGKGKHQFLFSSTGFYRNIQNWILWSRMDGDAFFSAQNIARVKSQGLENRFQWSYKGKKIELGFEGGYDFIQSTYAEAIQSPRREVGQQLIYVPKHKAFGTFRLNISNWHFQFTNSFTGRVSSINDGILDHYLLSSFYTSYLWTKGKLSSSIFLRVENLTNQQYRIIERRPMPGIHFRTGIKINFKK